MSDTKRMLATKASIKHKQTKLRQEQLVNRLLNMNEQEQAKFMQAFFKVYQPPQAQYK